MVLSHCDSRNPAQVSQLSTRLEQVLSSQSVQIKPPASKTEIGGAERAAIAEEQKQAADLQRVRRRRQQLEKELQELEAEVEKQVSRGHVALAPAKAISDTRRQSSYTMLLSRNWKRSSWNSANPKS